MIKSLFIRQIWTLVAQMPLTKHTRLISSCLQNFTQGDQPKTGDPSGDTPRLDLELLTPEPLPNGTVRSHQGDQTYLHYKIENNDLRHPVRIMLSSEGRQISGLPDGVTNDEEAYNNGLFRIASKLAP